ncbi:hypothetical protein MD484_g6886, partial [Candolleomyces efflorescens]
MNRFYDEEAAKRILNNSLTGESSQGDQGGSIMLSRLQVQTCTVANYEQPVAYRLNHTVNGEPEEVTICIPGILCSKTLPPFTRTPAVKSPKHVRHLRQFVRLTGLALGSFDESALKLDEVNQLFEASLPPTYHLQRLATQQYEGDVALDVHARYFTDRASVPTVKHVPFSPDVDPHHILEAIRGPQFIHAPENDVQYCRRITGVHETARYELLGPANFKEGDIVEAHVAFVAYPQGDKEYKLVMSLRSLALITSSCRQEADQLSLNVREGIQHQPEGRKRVAIGGTSVSQYSMSKAEIRRRVKAIIQNHYLPASFLGFMRANGGVISGSAVLSVFDPGAFVPNDVDVFVPKGRLSDTEAYLRANTMYVKVERRGGEPMEGQYSTEDTGVREAVLYVDNTSGRKINIIESQYTVATATIFKFHTTFVMNYITHNGIVSAYPKMTFDRVGLVNQPSCEYTTRVVRWLIKYALRGYNFLDRGYDWKVNVPAGGNCNGEAETWLFYIQWKSGYTEYNGKKPLILGS